MKCPQCRREIAYEAVEHKACGWTLPSRRVVRPLPAATGPVAKAPPLDPRLRAELDRLLKKSKAREQKKVERVRAEIKEEEVTEGHGRCFCELCFPKRVKHGQARVAPETEDSRAKGEGDASD